MTSSFTGSLPDDRATASSFAVSTVKLPEMVAVPPMIGSLMFGADSTLLSRMMANGLPTFSVVVRAKRFAPALSKLNVMLGKPPCWSNVCWARLICSPETITRR